MGLALKPGLRRRVVRLLLTPEAAVLGLAVAAIELLGRHAADDVGSIPWVLLLPLLFLQGCFLSRYHALPLTTAVLESLLRTGRTLRARMSLSLGLDFHPERHPQPPHFEKLRNGVLRAGLLAVILFQARGVLLEVLEALHAPGLHTLYLLLLAVVWAVLLVGIVVQVPATFVTVLELVKSRTPLEGTARLFAVFALLLMILALLVALDGQVGLEGCLIALAFATVLPSLLRPAEPPAGAWLNIAIGADPATRTAPLSDLVSDAHRFATLVSFSIVCLLAPVESSPPPAPLAVRSALADDADAVAERPRAARTLAERYPTTIALVRFYGWNATWLLVGGAVLAIGEFNRRRRLFDPAYARSRVLWVIPSAETEPLLLERHAVERAGWRLVVSDDVPGADDADLLVGLPPGMKSPHGVPLVSLPNALFLLANDAGAVLAAADERAKSERAIQNLERLLTSTRARMAEQGEGTFIVPHCWMVVGLTRDDDRARSDRSPLMAVGGNYQIAFGTRLRRFLHEVMTRAGIDVIYVEDSVSVPLVVQVLELIFDRHVSRVEPPELSDIDFVGLRDVRIVLHDVDPQTETISEVDAGVTRHAISRARILIIGRDKKDDDDDDGPPVDGEANDSWLREALRGIFPRLQPI